jgi:Flp pilus assembly protein TadG
MRQNPAMFRRAFPLALARRLARDRSGAFAMIFALMAIPLFIVIGAAVDYARVEHFKTRLQATVDSAALAGAVAYESGTATATATNYLNANALLLPGYSGTLTSSVSAATVSTGNNPGYTVTVKATANLVPTFMRIFYSTIPISATAVAVNPSVYINVASTFNSSAADANTVYWWAITSSNATTVPATSTFTSSNELATNLNSNQPAPFKLTTATDQIAIALGNVTGGKTGNYGCTQYQTAKYVTQKVNGKNEQVEDCEGTDQWFFSNIYPPSDNTDNQTGYRSTQNCSLQITVTTTAPNPQTPPSSGKCFTSTPTLGVFSCSQISGDYLTYYWNDMGGNTDDKDYNDAMLTINCTNGGGGSSTATTPYLTQ